MLLNVTTFTTSTESHKYDFVLNDISSFKATLVWTDPATASMSTATLVNDLDISVVINASSTTVYPNGWEFHF